jgi:hypothetical protein
MSKVVDIRLLASGQRVAVILTGGEVTALHLERSRLTPAELEELYSRVQDGEFPENGDEDGPERDE